MRLSLNLYSKPVQVLGVYPYQISVLPILHAGQLLFSPYEYVQTVAAMQAPVVVGKVKANVVTVS